MKNLFLIFSLCLSIFTSSVSFAMDTQVSEERKKELKHLILQDCGSCHGMTLKGGLGPSLLKSDLANKPKEFIYHTIANGRTGTAMPPWKNLLSDSDINWISDQLINGVAP